MEDAGDPRLRHGAPRGKMPAAHHPAAARDDNSTPLHAEPPSLAGRAADRRRPPPPRANSSPTPPQDPPAASRAPEIPVAPAAPERLDWAEIECAVYAYTLSAAPAAPVARRALNVIEEALERYGVDGGLCLSFNGGKDSTAVLHLAAAAWSRYCSLHGRPRPGAGELPSQPSSASPTSPPQYNRRPAARRLQIFYQTHDDAFDEEDEFVRHAVDVYSLDMVKIDGLTVRAALQQFLARNPAVRAVLVGTRRTDPHGGDLDHFAMTDPGYVVPQVMRVLPIIEWTYEQVWRFMRDLGVTYCPVYDKGYTSLGCKAYTLPNPALRNPDRICGYDPAWMLRECKREREGRR